MYDAILEKDRHNNLKEGTGNKIKSLIFFPNFYFNFRVLWGNIKTLDEKEFHKISEHHYTLQNGSKHIQY